MKTAWTRYASERLDALLDEIAWERGTAVADKWEEQLFSAVSLLDFSPYLGGEVREIGEPHIREIGIPPYRIIYRVMRTHCVVINVLHSRQSFSRDDILA